MKIGMNINKFEHTLDNTKTKAMLTPVDGVIFAQTHYIKSLRERHPTAFAILLSLISGFTGALIRQLFD